MDRDVPKNLNLCARITPAILATFNRVWPDLFLDETCQLLFA